MKSSHGELGKALLTDQAIEPLPHLFGRLVGEGHRQDRARRHRQVADEIRDAVGKDTRFSGPSAGQDQERPVAVGHGVALLGIQGVEDGVSHHVHRMEETDC